MALFGNDKPNWDADEEEKLNFFSTSEAQYTIPSSRKPVVVKKAKAAKSSAKKVSKPKAKTDKTKSEAVKKSAVKKTPAANPAEAKKAITKKTESTAAKKPAVKKAEATKPTESKKPAAKKADTSAPKKQTAKKAETAKPVEAKKTVAKKTESKTVKKSSENTTAKKAATSKPAVKKPAKAAVDIVEIEATETVTEVKTARNGSFDIKKSKDGRFVFNLYSANRVIIATSQVYSSSQSALTGIKSVMANAASAEIEDLTLKKPAPKAYPKWEIYIDRAGEYRFRLNASNANCICHAKAGYANKSNCKRGIDSIIRLAEDADVKKQYLNKK